MLRDCGLAAVTLTVLIGVGALPARAQIAVSANDGKVELVDGAIKYKKDGKDTISIIDLGATQPKVLAEIAVPASVVGPPLSVALTPNEELALVTSAKKAEGDPPKEASDDKLTVIDLKKGSMVGSLLAKGKALAGKALGKNETAASAKPEVIATLQAGKGAAGVSVNKAGTLALVANRDEGTVSIFTISGKTVTAAGKVTVGDEKSMPSHVVFTPDGKSALVSLYGPAVNKVAVLSVDGSKVEKTDRALTAGVAPYAIDISSKGDVAIVASMGGGAGDADVISVIDMKTSPLRVVNSASVPPSPEGMKISPDGQYVAVSSQNGSNKAKGSPYFNDAGKLTVFRIRGTDLQKVGEAPAGHWCQGVAWSAKSNRIFVQCMVEQEIQVFNFTGLGAKKLERGAAVKVSGGPAGIRTAER